MHTWTLRDRYGNTIYFTEERWHHILESRPELEPHFDKMLETLRTGRRRQDALIPNKYRYYRRFDELLPENNHLVLVVVFKTELDEQGSLKGDSMGALNLSKTEITAHDGTPVRLVYDQEADILEIFFGQNEPATGVELTDHIILRLNQQVKRAISLTFINFSILTERTEYGPRSYPLDRLDDISEDMRELVLQLVTSMPINQFLKVSHFQASPTERVPLTYVEAQPPVTVA